jgi:hypothetical protein
VLGADKGRARAEGLSPPKADVEHLPSPTAPSIGLDLRSCSRPRARPPEMMRVRARRRWASAN